MAKSTQTKEVRTIADIAQIAKVSPATVSRALNNSPLISTETIERIQAIAREHNFQTHAGAQSLRLQRSRTIAVVVTAESLPRRAMTDPFLLELLGEIASVAASHNYDLLLSEAQTNADDWSARFMRNGRADGIIIVAGHTDRMRQTGRLAADNLPFVVWGPALPDQGYCSVGSDDFAGGKKVVEHLIRLGRQRIALIGIGTDCMEARLRHDGYLAALAAAGHSGEPRYITDAQSTSQAGYEAMRRLLVQAPDLDAVFVSSDVMAIGALEALRVAGRSVPGDVSVVGYDDISLAAYCSPPLTTVRQNLPAAAKQLVERLLAHIEGRPSASIVLPTELVIRQSCGALVLHR